LPQAVSVVAQLGIPDLLADGPRTCLDLATATRTHAASLYRVMRLLAGASVFAEDDEGRFRLAALGECLRADVPGSLRGYAIYCGDAATWSALGALLHSVQTGEPSFEHLHGMGEYEFQQQHPELGRHFAAGMTALTTIEERAILSAYDFSDVGTLVDVGGGNGALLASILRANPRVRGVLFDLPSVGAGGESLLTAAGVRDRCEIVEGDFFTGVPPGDAYVLKRVLHNWDDDRCVTILRCCRQAMVGRGRVLALDPMVPPGNDPSLAKQLDVRMLVYTHGGRERTSAEYAALLTKAGLRLQRIVSTDAPVSIVEAWAV
jgi:hypothetical protein